MGLTTRPSPCSIRTRWPSDALIAPTRIYVKPVLPLMKAGLIKGAAHITGGGLIENPPRCIAEGLHAAFGLGRHSLAARVSSGWARRAASRITSMRRTFNCGVGFILVVAPENAEPVLAALLNAGEAAFVCGQLAAD
ncbi:MAG: hypothetical protein KL785_07665 [Brevundimonas sp.]|nr:hypothetical protein [Brevundimonas sp.]